LLALYQITPFWLWVMVHGGGGETGSYPTGTGACRIVPGQTETRDFFATSITVQDTCAVVWKDASPK